MRRKNIFKLFILVLTGVIFFSCNKSSDTTTPVRKDLVQAVYASGKLFPLEHYTLFAKLQGYVEAIHVKTGDTVKVNDKLITIRNDVNNFNISSAKNLYDLALENASANGTMLRGLKQDVESTHSKYELDSVNFNKYDALLKAGATSDLSFRQSKTQFELSRSNYFKSIEMYENTKQKLEVEAVNAKNQYESLLSNKKDYDLVSSINGKVYDVTPRIGDLINVQTPLMELGSVDQFETELAVDESDIGLINEGQEVAYSIDAFSGKIFKGRIVEIFQKVNSSNKTARIRASFNTENNFEAYVGMSVEANIIIADRKSTLVIPKEFLVNGNYIKVKGEDSLHKISKGAEDLEFVEILSGIDEKTVLVKQ